MHRLPHILASTFATLALLAPGVHIAAEPPPGLKGKPSKVLVKHKNPVEGQYIVVVQDGPNDNLEQFSRAMLRAFGAEDGFISALSNGLPMFGVRMTESQALALLNHPNVAWIEQNATGYFSGSQPTPSSNSLWHLDRIDQRDAIGGPGTGTYDWTSDGSGVDIYIVDSGVMANHDEFDADDNPATTWDTRVTAGANFVVHAGDNDPANRPCEAYIKSQNGGQWPASGTWIDSYFTGHGTSVASMAAGDAYGVAKGATVIPVKVAPCYGEHPTTGVYGPGQGTPGLYATAWGLDWILGQHQSSGRPSVVNMSIYFEAGWDNLDCYDANGNKTYCNCMHPEGPMECAFAIENNVYNLLSAGATVVSSANNQNENRCALSHPQSQAPARMGYGGDYDTGDPWEAWVITAGGLSIDDKKWLGSNYGSCVSMWAPADIFSIAHIKDHAATRSQFKAGTSFASPIVAGAAARILQRYPTLGPRQLWNKLKVDATKMNVDFITGDENVLYVAPSE